MSSNKLEAVPQYELLLWTRRFAAMIDSGVSLMRCLSVLAEEETTPALQDLTRMLMTLIEQGATLSDVISAEVLDSDSDGKLSKLFPAEQWHRMKNAFGPEYVACVRFGEIGGILEVALDRLVERYENGVFPLPPARAGKLTRAELAEWFWWFGKMLEAGVPVLFALETLKRVSRQPLQRISQELHDEVSDGASLAPAREDERPAMWRYPSIFNPTTRQLVEIGIWHRPLHEALLGVAALLEREALLEKEGRLPPLPVPRMKTEPSPGEKPHEKGPAVRQVNDVFAAAIEAEADQINLIPMDNDLGRAEVTKAGEVVRTIPMERYDQCVRRVKVMAAIDPFTNVDHNSQIHVRYQGRAYVVHVTSRPATMGKQLWLRVEVDKAVEL